MTFTAGPGPHYRVLAANTYTLKSGRFSIAVVISSFGFSVREARSYTRNRLNNNIAYYYYYMVSTQDCGSGSGNGAGIRHDITYIYKRRNL